MNERLKDRLKSYLESEHISISAFSAKLGYSTATLSTYLSGKFKGNVENVEAKIEEFFENLDAASELGSSGYDNGYVPTSISQGVYQTIRLCHLKGGLAIECGDPGIGKTMACLKYIEDFPASAIYLSANPCFATASAFLRLMCNALGLRTGNKADMWLRIRDNLTNGEHRVLIIDEAQHLTIKAIDTVRSFYDENPKLGICFVGNSNIALTGGKNAEDYAQVKSRTRDTEIRHTSEIKEADIKLLFPVGEKSAEVNLLLAIARSPQGIRGAKNVYSNALDNGNVTYNGLLAICKAMKIRI